MMIIGGGFSPIFDLDLYRIDSCGSRLHLWKSFLILSINIILLLSIITTLINKRYAYHERWIYGKSIHIMFNGPSRESNWLDNLYSLSQCGLVFRGPFPNRSSCPFPPAMNGPPRTYRGVAGEWGPRGCRPERTPEGLPVAEMPNRAARAMMNPTKTFLHLDTENSAKNLPPPPEIQWRSIQLLIITQFRICCWIQIHSDILLAFDSPQWMMWSLSVYNDSSNVETSCW